MTIEMLRVGLRSQSWVRVLWTVSWVSVVGAGLPEMFGLCGAVGGLGVPTAHAEDPSRRVLDLNRSAIDAYNKLELEQAKNTLLGALQITKKFKIQGDLLARTYMNLGVVMVGGFNKHPEGEQYFVQALKEDPNATLDPMLATPEIQSVLDQARAKVGLPPLTFGPATAVVAPVAGPTAGTSSVLKHLIWDEQLHSTSLPIYVEAPANVAVDHVALFYRAGGATSYVRAEMQRIENGWGYEIGCEEVRLPEVEYYVVAYGRGESIVGAVGSEVSPVVVPIVEQRTSGKIPALPGRTPPVQCAVECPLGAPGCASAGLDKLKGAGDPCYEDNECSSDMRCVDEVCVPESGDGASYMGMARFFVQIGPTMGFAYVKEGMPADTPRPSGSANSTFGQGWVSSGESAVDACEASSPTSTTYCVRIAKAGFVPTYAAKLVAGYYVSKRLALAGMLRFQPNSGEGPLSSMLIGARLQYLVLPPSLGATGVWASIHLGGSVGQIQPQPSQPSGVGEPFVIAGITGIEGGGSAGYRFTRNIGAYFSPEINFLFPTTLLNLDFTAGMEFAF
jgi:hypothetical protein